MNENTSIDHTNIGMRLNVMPGARILKIVTMKLIAPDRRGDADEDDREAPEVDVDAGRVRLAGERHVREPTAVGRMADEHARVQEQAGEQEDPVAERVEPREGHVAAADLQRDQVVAEPGQHRRVEQEDHRRAVHREELVVGLGRQDVVVRRRELVAHHERGQAGDEEEHERRVDVAHADPLVVDGREEARDARRVAPLALEPLERSRRRAGRSMIATTSALSR